MWLHAGIGIFIGILGVGVVALALFLKDISEKNNFDDN